MSEPGNLPRNSPLLIPSEHEIHVWSTWLPEEADADALARFAAVLTADEQERAAKFLVAKAKNEFIATRGVLRELLAAYLGDSPSEIQLQYGPKGKPDVYSKRVEAPLRFNVSHSHGLAMLSVTRTADVGIDVEKIREDFGGAEIANSYFSEGEVQELDMLPPHLRAQGFFNCWTRKEAYVKARGDGLQVPLRSFDVRIATEQPQALRDEAGSRWTIYALAPAAGFTGAVAVRGEGFTPRYGEWRASETGFGREVKAFEPPYTRA